MPTATTDPPVPARRGTRSLLVALLGLALAACASTGGPGPRAGDDAGACRPTGEATRAGTLTVAAPGDVDPLHAPLPTSDAEHLLFRQLYATLVEVDCRGRIRAGLAEDWSSGEDGRRWTFRLGPEARFADGAPVTAEAVLTAWHGTDLAGGAGRRSPLASADVSAPTQRTLVVTLETPVADAALFAAPRFAVAGAGGSSAWPAPSGAFRPGDVAGPHLPGRTVGLVPRGEGAGGSRIRLAAFGTGGARDVLDAGTDLLWTRDPAAARYAGSLDAYRVHPLPWDRVWVLAVPRPAGAGTVPDSAGWAAVRQGLAGEAVPAEARPAGEPGPWAACSADGGRDRGRPGVDTSGRGVPGRTAEGGRPGPIVHPAAEPSARALAARLAALAGGAGPEGAVVARELGAGGSALRTEALGPADFRASLREGSAAAYLMAVPRRPLSPCHLRDELLRRVPWLSDGGRLVPLVETRPLLVLGRDVAGVRLGWDGVPRLEGAGRR